jgi:xanthine dehydrogenase YagR molybdenum-binding subunit
MTYMLFRSGLGMSSAVLRLNAQGEYTLFVGVTDVGAGAKTTMGLIAAEALDIPLSKLAVVSGDTDRCPYSVGESGSRTTIMTGTAVVEAVRDIQKQVAEKGMPTGDQVYIASASPNPRLEGKARASFGAHFCEVEVDTELGDVRVTKYTTVHDSGRLMNPLSAKGQIQGAVIQGIGMALHEDMVYDRRSGQPLTCGYYGARVATHLDAPDVEVTFLENDDGYGPFGAKSIGEAGIILAPACVGNAIFNAIGTRMKDTPITRSRIMTALGARA